MKPIRLLFQARGYHTAGRRTFLTRWIEWGNPLIQPVVWVDPESPAQRFLNDRGIENWVPPPVSEMAEAMLKLGIQLVQTDGYAFELARAARRARIPHLFRMGASIPQGVRDFQPDQLIPIVMAVTELSQAVVCPSRYVGAPFPQATVILNGVDVDAVQPGPAGSGRRVSLVAHLLPPKRHLDFLAAADLVHERRPEAEFFLLGEDYHWPEAQLYAEQVRQQVARRPYVTLSHFPSLQQMMATDIVVLPSQEEGASNALLEAMARGQAVVASDSGGNPEFVEHGQNGLLFPLGEVDKLAEAILELLDDPARRQALGATGRRRAEERFSLHHCLQRYLEVYLQLTDAAAAQPAF